MPWSGSYLIPKNWLNVVPSANGVNGKAEEGGLRDAGDAVRTVGHLGPVEQDDADDLSKRQGDDGEIVAAEPQHGKAEDDAPQRRGKAGDRQAKPEPETEMGGKQREGVGADRVEGDIAEVEQAGEPDHDVEPPAEHHIGEHEDGEVEPVAKRQAEMERLLEAERGERKEQGEQNAADHEDPSPGEIGEEMNDGAAQEPEADEDEHGDRDQLVGRRIEEGGDDEANDREQRGGAEHHDVAFVEWIAPEQFGEGRGERILRLPDEQVEQEPAEEHDADGDGEQHGPRAKRETGDVVHGAQAQHE